MGASALLSVIVDQKHWEETMRMQQQGWFARNVGYLIALVGSTLALLTTYFVPYTLDRLYFPTPPQRLSDLLWPARFTVPDPVWITMSLVYLLSVWGSALLALLRVVLPEPLSRKFSWASVLILLG